MDLVFLILKHTHEDWQWVALVMLVLGQLLLKLHSMSMVQYLPLDEKKSEIYLLGKTPPTRSTPLHIKTNWRTNNGAMYRFKIEWYLYANPLPIDSECVGYLYNTTDSITNPLCKDSDTWITLTQYKSSDGYLVLKATPNTSWYYGWFWVSLQHQFHLSQTN